MNIKHARFALGMALTLGVVGIAQAVERTGSAAPATSRNANQESVTSGIVSSVDVERGVVVVSGRIYRFTSADVSFSDDRKKPEKGGLAGLQAGTKVTIRSTAGKAGPQAIQIVARD